MHNFKQTKIALAVGASLLVMAGAAQAAVPGGAPTLRATKPVLVTPASQANADSIYVQAKVGATLPGLTGTLPVKLYLQAPSDSVATNFAALNAGTDLIKVNAANGAGPTTGASVATDDIAVYAGTLGATQVNLHVTGAAFTANPGGATTTASNGVATVAFNIMTAGTEAIRIVASTGVLEYTADNTVAAPTWLPVSMAVQQPAAAAGVNNAITATDSTAATVNSTNASTPIATVAGQSLFNTLAPTIAIKTHGTAAGLVDGVTVDTVTPLVAVPAVGATASITAATANVNTAACPTGTITGATDLANPTAPATGLSAGVLVAGSVAQYNVLFATPTTADWTTGAAAADAAAYSSACFNTGIAGTTVPFALSATATTANQSVYQFVFDTAGAQVKLAALPAAGAVTDGAAPVLMSATTNATAGTLALVFSEPLSFLNGNATTPDTGTIGGAVNDLREVAENVLVVSDSLAALNLNNGGTLSAANANSGGLSTLTITDASKAIATYSAGKAITVNTGIGLAESDDTGWTGSATLLVQDPLGGLKSVSAVVEGASGTKTTAAATINVVFNDCTASAATTVADPTKVGTITCKFPAGREIAYAAGKTAADLVNQIQVTVNGTGVGNAPVVWDFFPSAAQLAVSAAGDTLTVTIPTPLLYAKVNNIISMTLNYYNVPGGGIAGPNVLVAKALATDVVDAGTRTVTMPLSAIATLNTLLTQSITGTLTGATNGSLVHAYLAKWIDAPTSTVSGVTFTSGKITNPGDKVATDLAIEFADGTGSALAALITAQLNAAAAAAPAVAGVSAAAAAVPAAQIPVYVMLVRSNDAVANTKGTQNYLEARAVLATTRNDAAFDQTLVGTGSNGAKAGATDINPVYECMLDPKTGIISGRLTGNITIKPTTVTASRGLKGAVSGSFGTLGATDQVAQGLVDSAGKFNLLVGVDPTTADIAGAAKANQLFVILVHEDQANARTFTQLTSASNGAANFVPFDPNLINLKGTRTVLGVAPGIAAPFTATTAAPTAANINLANYLVDTLTASARWALMGARNPANATPAPANASFPRNFVGLSATGVPQSFWTNEVGVAGGTLGGDMALAMVGNKVSLATELGINGDTLSTFAGSASFVPGAVAVAWLNDGGASATTETLTFAQTAAPAAAVKAPAGWSLVTVPAAGLTAATIDAIINVGAQTASQFTWIKATDGAMPTLSAGQPVFVFSKAGGNL